MQKHFPSNRRRQNGFTLVELLVSIIVSLVVIAAIGNMVVFSESRKRTLTTGNDLEQGASYALVQLDSALRSAGSGFMQSNLATILGCRLAVGNDATRVLPRYEPWPAPFQNVMASAPENMLLAPALIAENSGPNESDVLILMRGNGSAGDITRYLNEPSGNDLQWPMITSLGFKTNDLVLASNTSNAHCMMEHIANPNAAATGDDINTTVLYDANASRFYTPGYPDSTGNLTATLSQLTADKEGNLTVIGTFDPATGRGGNAEFYMYGIDAAANLHRYDLLEFDGANNADLVISDNIVGLYALYGIDSDNDGVFDSWVSPQTASSDYTIEALTSINRNLLKNIVALRLALVIRSPLQERQAVAPESLTAFAGVTDSAGNNLEKTFTITAANQLYRHRVAEASIPIRNALLSSDPRFVK